MGSICEKITVACPACHAEKLLEIFFREHVVRTRALDGRHAVRLQLQMPHISSSADASAPSNVAMTLMPLPAPLSASRRIAVEWEPLDAAAPSFAGNLLVEPDEGDHTFRLVLTGTGDRVASATVRELLGRMRDVIEHSHRDAQSSSAQPDRAPDAVLLAVAPA